MTGVKKNPMLTNLEIKDAVELDYIKKLRVIYLDSRYYNIAKSKVKHLYKRRY